MSSKVFTCDTRLDKDLVSNVSHKVFFGKCFTILKLMHHLKNKKLLAVRTIGMNFLDIFPLTADKDLEKQGLGSIDYRTESNLA